MKVTAILIDGAWLYNALRETIKPSSLTISADLIHKNALAMLGKDEDLFRIFYYDSMPFEGKEANPINKQVTDYANTNSCKNRKRFFQELGEKDLVALRRGQAKPRGWFLTEEYFRRLMCGTGPMSAPTGSDVRLEMVQKGVDMRIGIDVATLSIKRLVQRIILVSGDMDMIPAIKLARREGVQVVIVQVGNRKPPADLIEDADILRTYRIVTN